MTSSASGKLRASVPGRICLFGEHQDYLGLPVIAMAIDLRLELSGRITPKPGFEVQMHDLNMVERFRINGDDVPCRSNRDFLPCASKLLHDLYGELPGVSAEVTSRIPINSGTSSSSALVLAWMATLMSFIEQPVAPMPLARLAHQAEVLRFNAPGGMMDHVAIAFGGVQRIDFEPQPQQKDLEAELGSFVLGDSLEPKDTYGHLARIQTPLLELRDQLAAQGSRFQDIAVDDVKAVTGDREALAELLLAALHNRDLLLAAQEELEKEQPDPQEVGRLLDEHQQVLDRRLGLSTPKIDAMLAKARQAGALGGKINGSGGGGAMFAYAPENPAAVARAIEQAGGRAYIVSKDVGVCLGETEQDMKVIQRR